ncbi:hypothetical protein MO973_27215 [Paenibacillus sp. TRM 82003]|nr:hypothetical protein [Paenibacillus sp. TRM 82003]
MAKQKKDQADAALLSSYNDVAGGETEGEAGSAETQEQWSDAYASGGNEHTFLRDGQDLGKTDGYRPK